VTRSETASRIRERIDEIYRRGVALGDDGNAYEIGLTSIPREGGSFITDLVHVERPLATLETGMAWGLSTLFILQSLLDNGDEFRPHVVMDPFQSATFHNAANRSLRELGIADLVEFHEEPSELALPQLVRDKRQFDLAFIDADHRFDGVFVEFRFIHSLLKPGGLVIFDDSVRDAVHLTCRFAETNLGYRKVGQAAWRRTAGDEKPDPTGIPARVRFTAYRKPAQELERSSQHFVPFFDGVSLLSPGHGAELRLRGRMALAAGDLVLARRLLLLSLLAEPYHRRTYLRLLRTFLPRKLARVLSARPQLTPVSTIGEASDRSTP
jgi:predicted O-methyltransferase YrrM